MNTSNVASNSAPPTHQVRGIVLMLASTVFFTANVLLVRALGELESVNVWLVSCTRFITGIALILAVYRREFQLAHLFTNPKLVGRGIVGGIGVYGFYLTVVHLGAGRATFINNTYVIFGALLAVVVLRERFSVALGMGSAAALAGLALLTNAFASNTHAGIYDFLAIAVAWASAYVVVTIRQLHATESTSTIFGAQCVFGLLICGVPAAFYPKSISPAAWAVMFLAGVFAAAGQLAMTRAFRELPVGEGSLIQTIVPLGIAFGGFAFFGEHFRPHEIVGAALILAGTMLASLRRTAPLRTED